MTEDEQLWLDAPAERPALVAGEAHVWRARLECDKATLAELSKLLSADELERARRFHFPKDCNHYVAARGALRDILSRYVGVEPARLRFSYDQYGKPSLQGEPNDAPLRSVGDAPLRFNVSHSQGVALYALTRGREVGVDIEFVREDFAGFDIAERFFSTREVSALRALPAEARTAAFFDCWTRKEAYIKARGEGLSHPLHSFAVSLAPGERAALLWTEGDSQEAARWSLIELFPGESYRAALAVEGEMPTLRCWRWSALLL